MKKVLLTSVTALVALSGVAAADETLKFRARSRRRAAKGSGS
jgi:hypothetical protein